MKRRPTNGQLEGIYPGAYKMPKVDSHAADGGELADAALAPLRTALAELRERSPAVCMAAALGSLRSNVDPSEEACATHMTPLRRAEFIGGRLAIRQALQDAGHAAPVVVADGQGVPLFPEGYVGSIAHKHGRAVAIAAKTTTADGLGIDLEFDENCDEESLVAEIITEVERPGLAAIRAAEPTVLSPATLVLAAKESVYKAVFQITRTKFDFDDAELTFRADSRSFWAARFPGDKYLAVRGEYEIVDRWIIAIAYAVSEERGPASK
ncbi:4'-phosphopantetheinyl transferase family protein [Corallococcus exiguus]|uniref:4'-phosphopantetheinyl transferase family protein n=1 Tax=Corallococcus exiguus TaxID=83462 RepID=UPI003DA6AF20